MANGDLEVQTDLPGFPLYDHAKEPATKADLFFITSVLYRICITQQMALESLRHKSFDDFKTEIDDADAMLRELYGMLQRDND
jgi:hypothetical protein